METYKKSIRMASLLLVFVTCLTFTTPFSQARASDYLASYGSYTWADGNGKVSVWFNVTGTKTMDEIGATIITLYENSGSGWKAVKTFKFKDTSNMLAYNTNFHGGSVSYNGVAGRSYYADVYVWAGKNGLGDDRSMRTDTIVAK